MNTIAKRILTALILSILTSVSAHAGLIKFTQEFTGGFNVSINGGASTASGPITIIGIVDDSAIDIDSSGSRGEFALVSATFTGAGFLAESITTSLSLLVFDVDNFGFQLQGQTGIGVTAWNGTSASGAFITDVNDLTTLSLLPYTTTGTSTFWSESIGNPWTLASGDTINANPNTAFGGPDGTFSIESFDSVPEPTTPALMILGLAGIGFARAKKSRGGKETKGQPT